MKRALLTPCFLAYFLSFFVSTATVLAQEAPLQGLDAYIETMIADWNIPGVAVAVVKDGRVIHASGYGEREIGTRQMVDEHTLFAIGSASKAFTSAAIAILVDEGKLDWDDPVTDHLPWFQLYDPYVTRELRIRDLMAHNSGLKRGDRVWYGINMSREEVVRRARYLPPAHSFRSTFEYNNTMFIAAGLIVETVTGDSWDDFITRRIFQPLGMTQSNTSVDDLAGLSDVSTPHITVDGKPRTMPWRNIDNAGPAGSINSNILDMAQWVRLQLASGEYGSEQLISAVNIQETHTSQMIVPPGGRTMTFPDSDFLNYGLGWFLAEYRGRKMVTHNGNIDGNTAQVAMIPQENIGLVILNNLNGANAFSGALTHHIFDRLLGGVQNDWSHTQLALWEELLAQQAAAVEEAEASRIEGTKTSLPLHLFAGTYTHAMYDDIVVEYNDGKLAVRFADSFEAELEHWNYDTFRALWSDASQQGGLPKLMRFVLGPDGMPAVLHADIEGTVPFDRESISK